MWRTLIASALLAGCQPAERHDPPPIVQLRDAATIDPGCAASVLREITGTPDWRLTIEDKQWSDDGPSQVVQTVELDEHTAKWRFERLPQSIELLPQERADLLAAIGRGCAPTDAGTGNGFTGHYIVISRDQLELRIPDDARASLDSLQVIAKIRARFVQQRLPLARTMKLTVNGRYRTGDNEWQKDHAVSVHDGQLWEHYEGGDEPSDLDAESLVNTLDIALQLPETEKGADTFTGTLTVDGHTRPIAVRFPNRFLDGEHDTIQTRLRSWWWINHHL